MLSLLCFGCFPMRVMTLDHESKIAMADRVRFTSKLPSWLYKMTDTITIIITSIQFSTLKTYLLRETISWKTSIMSKMDKSRVSPGLRRRDPKTIIATIKATIKTSTQFDFKRLGKSEHGLLLCDTSLILAVLLKSVWD